MHLRSLRLLLFCLFISFTANAQDDFLAVRDSFKSPLEIPLLLSGTFGELRSRHFHAGIDIKTQGKEGLNVLATASGTVSRIKVSPYGYGNAVYISHPTGFTSVYAHLQSFDPAIAALVKKEQYAAKNFQVDFAVPRGTVNFEQGEVIGISGNSGGSGGPHLHFEIRESSSEHALNPLKLNFGVKDDRAPIVSGPILIYKIDSPHYFQTQSQTLSVVPSGPNGYKLKDGLQKVNADKIALGVRCFDLLNGAKNWNGIYELKLTDNGKELFGFKMDELDFSEGGYIHSFIDYGQQHFKNKTYIKCFKEKGNHWSFYDDVDAGYIDLSDGLVHKIEIVLSDLKGNTAKVSGSFQRDENGLAWEGDESYQQLMYSDLPNHSQCGNLSATFAHKNFFGDVPFSCCDESGELSIGDPKVPVYRSYKICLADVEHDVNLSDKYLLQIKEKPDSKGSLLSSCSWEGDSLCGKSKLFGTVSVIMDTLAPKIKPRKDYKKVELSKSSKLAFSVKDDLSGIGSYNAYLDGSWIVMAYDAKNNKFSIDFSQTELDSGEHELNVVFKDGCNNISYFTLEFKT